MLHLKSIAIDRFKSFRHAELLFSRGFTCIVGPNGSGKSNICDALLFGLGETSLRRLRVNTLEHLLPESMKKKANGEFSKGYVRIEFGGEQELTIVKAVRSDGKTAYKVNGKHMTRKDVQDVLLKYGVKADETSTIAQGEITKIIELNPKERRELIDIASGIKEFEYKKNEAMKELDQVGQRINEARIMLSERAGFLSELEKEKEVAEQYIKLGTRLKSLRYSVLVARKELMQNAFESASKEMAVLDSRKSERKSKLDELSKKIEKLSSESQQITREMNEMISSSGETSKRMELISKESATIEAEVKQLRLNVEESERFITESKATVAETNAKMSSNESAINEISREISRLEAELSRFNAEIGSDEFGRKAAGLSESISEAGNRIIDVQGYISKLQADISMLEAKKSDAGKRVKALTLEIEEKAKARNARLDAKGELEKSAGKISGEVEKVQRAIVDINKELEKIDEALINLREQRTLAHSKDEVLASKLSTEFKEEDGFYGRASQLCSYKSEYATAIEVAAGSRFDYFVTDSIETANGIISYLKKNGLGRATFMPINDLNVEPGRKEADISLLIDLVKFDSKFGKVFTYIFGNTYLIEEATDAKKYGVGRHRYVTLSGELIEQSGIVSGGSQRARVSLASIENKLRDLGERKQELRLEFDRSNERLFSVKKGQASAEIEARSANAESEMLNAEIGKMQKELDDALSTIKEFDAKASRLGAELTAKDGEKLELVKSNESANAELKSLYSIGLASKADSKKNAKDKEQAEGLRKRMEEIKMNGAGLAKENQLLKDKADDLSRQAEQKARLLKEAKSTIKEKEIRAEVLSKSRQEIEDKAKSAGETNRKAYEKLKTIETESAKLGEEKGRLSSENENIERQLNDAKLKKSQSETRLSDIAAELVAYGPGLALAKESIDDMEKEVAVINSKLAELGNPNLKAPEMYEEKKRNVEEAQGKVNTLEAERQAVMRMIEEIDSKKLQTFMDTFNEVNKNFAKLYNYIFPGSAMIRLDDVKDPLNSGLDIKIALGKTEKSVNSMSGGEKSLISLVMLFAIHTYKPSSLYIFDEVDSALDKENSKKLSLLIKQMSKDAQFIVVSHNDSLIVNADTAIGVVKTEGESKVVGIEISSFVSNKR